VPADKHETEPLGMSAMMIGMMPDQTYDVARVTIPPGSTLFVFSDGAYEIVTKDGDRWELENFLPLLTAPSVPQLAEPERVYQAIKEVVKPGPLDDDLSLLALTFL
jgi:sigma-B regulation protein RsbU (phosphoserine phosphatase)